MRLIPAIDIRDGRCVRLLQGDFGRETRYDVDPVALAADYASRGVDWIHVVDLDGAARGAPVILPLIARIRQASKIAVQFGGGIRNAATLAETLRTVQRAVIGSLAVSDPAAVKTWIGTYGGDRITLALDVRYDDARIPRLTTHGWTRSSAVSLWDALAEYAADGLQHVLCTDVERDGALSGPNFALYEECKHRWPEIEFQASGGVRDAADLERLAAQGVDAAISGKALLEGRIRIEEIAAFLPNA
jgi:phosphoribosylformimino-5-aminoimidazole carboxamide ribotide isomerase